MPAQNSASLTTTGSVVVQPTGSDGEVRVTATGTYTGLQGKLQGSIDGTTYVDLTAFREDTAAALVGTIDFSAANFSVVARARGWPFLKFLCSQLSTGTAVIDIRSASTFNAPAPSAATVAAQVAQTITSASANALAVGPNGTTNPTLQVDGSTSSAATGLKVKSAAAASGLAVSVLSSGTDESLTIDAKGTGTVTLNGTATGNVVSGTGLTSKHATAGLGYSTGAGGTVTQASSRTTGVTLNKVTGAITLVSAAGSATPASFTVTNSAVAATDTVLVSQKSGTDLYEIFVTAVAAGSFRITSFTTGGTTTEQPVFNFAVIKGVAA